MTLLLQLMKVPSNPLNHNKLEDRWVCPELLSSRKPLLHPSYQWLYQIIKASINSLSRIKCSWSLISITSRLEICTKSLKTFLPTSIRTGSYQRKQEKFWMNNRLKTWKISSSSWRILASLKLKSRLKERSWWSC